MIQDSHITADKLALEARRQDALDSMERTLDWLGDFLRKHHECEPFSRSLWGRWFGPPTRREIVRAAYPEHYERIMTYAEPAAVCVRCHWDRPPRPEEEASAAVLVRSAFMFDRTSEGADFWHELLGVDGKNSP